jgi:hypothetical protein
MCLWPETVWLIVGVCTEQESGMHAWWLDVDAVGAVSELSITNDARATSLKSE